MKNKPYDIPYSGCRKDKILNAHPELNTEGFRMLVYWVKERYIIHLKKDYLRLPAPWTEDPILKKVRFTNVKRELDKESAYIIQKVCQNPSLGYEQKIASICLFRMLNKHESVDGILPTRLDDPLYFEQVEQWVKQFPKDYKEFKKVFMVSGMMGQINAFIGKRDSGITSCVDYCKLLWDQGVFYNLSQSTSAESIYTRLEDIPGIGSFMAYQLFVDMTYCPECPVSENEFVVAGPGCKNGLKLVFNSKNGLTPEELLFWLRDHWKECCQSVGVSWDPELFCDCPEEDRNMNVMSLQNCFCELSKYYRAYQGGFVIKYYNKGE